MPTIAYHTLAAHLRRASVAEWPPVTLVYGEEMLCQKACAAVLDLLVPQSERALAVERFDGADDSMGTVLASLNTYALLSDAKVVLWQDSRLFYSPAALQGLQEKMIQAAQSGDLPKASRPLVNLMALSGLSFADLTTPALRNQVVADVDGQPRPWLAQLIDYCRANRVEIPDKRDDADRFGAALEKGFPDGHRLIITTDWVDRRKALFKAIEAKGMVVDCAVPKGENRADRMAQDAVMQSTLNDALARAGKKMAGKACQRLLQSTGFDLRTLAGNLEKLISYVGDRPSITAADVEALIKRTRKDPIFEFTNAVADRDLSAALFFMRSLLEEGMHPLQLLAALANQIRRLLVAKSFLVRDRGRTWSSDMAFARFQATTLEAIQADDERAAQLTQSWNSILNPCVEGKKPQKTVSSDLVLAKHPKSAFAVFQTFKKADPFSLEALIAAMINLSQSDRRIKSTGQDPRLILEAFLMRLCHPPD
jgi:DNA polymerase III subunit delta